MRSKLPEYARLSREQAVKVGIPPELGSDSSFGANGIFLLNCKGSVLRCMVSDAPPWEHVSVSLRHRIPTWDEMCFVKSVFWDDEEAVVQFHPPKSQYVNYHPYTLHLWKNTFVPFPLPPMILVGPHNYESPRPV